MARPIFLFSAICLLASHVCAATTATLVQAAELAKLPLATVVRVVDGDTVMLDAAGKQIECRLAGVDAPEAKNGEGDVDAQGAAARIFLENLLEGERVHVAVAAGSRQHDEFGRLLAFLFRAPDGLYVNLELVRQGYARVFRAAPFPHLAAFLEWEQRAQKTGKGIWSSNPADGSKPSASAAGGAKKSPVVAPRGFVAPPAGGSSQVYVTESGEKYHRSDCSALLKSRIPISLAEARRKFEPCRLCSPPQ